MAPSTRNSHSRGRNHALICFPRARLALSTQPALRDSRQASALLPSDTMKSTTCPSADPMILCTRTATYLLALACLGPSPPSRLLQAPQ